MYSTEYLQESDFQRAKRILKHTIGKPDSFDDYDTLASVAIAHRDYEEAVEYIVCKTDKKKKALDFH